MSMDGTCHCGAVSWRLSRPPETATSCNCTLCRRNGALWAYGYEGDTITIIGETRAYVQGDATLADHFCGNCGCNVYWRALEADEAGRRRMAVNLRLAEPADVADVKLRFLDGFDSWDYADRGVVCMRDIWF